MSRLIVGPFNRVEGDLEVRLDIAEGRVVQARVTAPMYRGFEPMLVGRDPLDALAIVPRICGICSVSQSVAAARALADWAGVEPPANGLWATELMLAVENAADHLTHFTLFFMPDTTRPLYAGRPWFAQAEARFAAMAGSQARAAVAARARWLEIVGTLGGKWPHTHSIAPGGSARAVDAAERLRLLSRVREFRSWLEREFYAAPLAEVLALRDWAALQAWRRAAPGRGDLRLFLDIADDCGWWSLGPGPGDWIAHPSGAVLPTAPTEATAWPGGRVQRHAEGEAARLEALPLDWARVTEDSTHSWLAGGAAEALHPWAGQTLPQADKADGYSWAKAPRLGGAVVEVGALARQLVRGQSLICDTARRHGSSVGTRVLARLIELAALLPRAEALVAALQPQAPFCNSWTSPGPGQGFGGVEAARGALGHWLQVDGGRIARYQIVAPTSWNFSPRDGDGVPGALERALEGAPVQAGERSPVAVQHIVRSFDPCMVCTAH